MGFNLGEFLKTMIEMGAIDKKISDIDVVSKDIEKFAIELMISIGKTLEKKQFQLLEADNIIKNSLSHDIKDEVTDYMNSYYAKDNT